MRICDFGFMKKIMILVTEHFCKDFNINLCLLYRIYRLAGYQCAATVKNLTSSIITELEESMHSFPNLLLKYAESNNITLTRMDKLHIYGCFQGDAIIGPTDSFEDFAFRNGDKTLLLQVARLINE